MQLENVTALKNNSFDKSCEKDSSEGNQYSSNSVNLEHELLISLDFGTL